MIILDFIRIQKYLLLKELQGAVQKVI